MKELTLDHINSKTPYKVGNRLFLRWFSEGADESHFTIKTAHCLVEQQMFYTAIIIRNDHPNYSAVISEFDMTATELSNKPQS